MVLDACFGEDTQSPLQVSLSLPCAKVVLRPEQEQRRQLCWGEQRRRVSWEDLHMVMFEPATWQMAQRNWQCCRVQAGCVDAHGGHRPFSAVTGKVRPIWGSYQVLFPEHGPYWVLLLLEQLLPDWRLFLPCCRSRIVLTARRHGSHLRVTCSSIFRNCKTFLKSKDESEFSRKAQAGCVASSRDLHSQQQQPGDFKPRASAPTPARVWQFNLQIIPDLHTILNWFVY